MASEHEFQMNSELALSECTMNMTKDEHDQETKQIGEGSTIKLGPAVPSPCKAESPKSQNQTGSDKASHQIDRVLVFFISL